MFRRRREKLEGRVTIDDLAAMYDARQRGGSDRYRSQARTSVGNGRKPRSYTVAQGDVRLARIRARADGIRFALQHERLSPTKVRELKQVLQNLELAIRGMEASLREG